MGSIKDIAGDEAEENLAPLLELIGCKTESERYSRQNLGQNKAAYFQPLATIKIIAFLS